MSTPLFVGWMGLSKNHRRVGSRFSCENGEQSIRVKYCFSLILYEFCSSNALYSASLLFGMFIFRLIHFKTWDCYYFGLNISLVLLIKVLFIRKRIYRFCSLLKMKQLWCMSLFLRLSIISLGRYWRKSLAKGGGTRKKDKKGEWPYRGEGCL